MRAARYGIAVFAVGVALVLTRAFPELLSTMRLFFFWSAVLCTAAVAGTGPALLAIVLSSFGAAFLIYPPIGSFAIHEPIDVARLVLFVLFSGALSAAVGQRRNAVDRANLLSSRLQASEERYRTLVETTPTPQAVWTASADGRIHWSDAWLAITGQSREEVERGGGMSIVDPADAARTWQRWNDAVARQTYYEDEIRVRVRGGRYRWFAIKAVPLWDGGAAAASAEDMEPVGRSGRRSTSGVREWVGMITDIHDRRRHEDNALFVSRASEILGSSLDHEQILRILARLAVPHLGDWCAIDIARDGAPYERLVVEHNDPRRVQLIMELDRRTRATPEVDPIVAVLKTGKPQLLEELSDEMLEALAGSEEQLRIARNLGLRSWIIAPMTARGKTLGALTVVYSDDSGRRYTEEDVPLIEDLARRAAMAVDNARLFQQAEAANRTKDEFLATLSHELRTPLTAISGWANMLQLGLTDEKTTKLAVDTIARSAKQQAELIDDLLDLSRVVAGTLHLDIVTLDLVTIVEEVIHAARPAAEAKGLSLGQTNDAAVALVRGDDRRVRQIVWNLVSNAVKFTDDGGSVDVTVGVRDSQARVEVRDSGRGIAPEFLPYVWERFRQGDSSTSRQYGGLGLGLAVVRHLAELHGGTVSASSAGAGQGSTFAVELPLARFVHAAEAFHQPAMRGEQPLRGRKILVVDDDTDARTVIVAMLRRFGGDVAAADSVAAALPLFDGNAFDVVVSDLAMPNEDGYTLLKRVRTKSTVPMVAVSAIASSSDDRRRVIEAGFAEFLRKPVDPQELALTVARVVTSAQER